MAEIDRSLKTCSSKLKEDSAGWQRLQLLLASREDWVKMCAERIQSDLREAADRNYESGNATDQSYRQQMNEISRYVSDQKATDIAGSEYENPSVKNLLWSMVMKSHDPQVSQQWNQPWRHSQATKPSLNEKA